jgi:predicted anti-sigma-YlaC factor YlaD
VRCEDVDDLIEAVAGGETVAPEAEAHLAACPQCRARVDLARALDRLLLVREVPAPPEGFTAQVMRRVSHERWRVEQVVDVGFNLAMVAGLVVVLGGTAGLLWSMGWVTIDVAALSTVTTVVAPWTSRLVGEAQMLALAALLLSFALGLWWWMEGEAAIE